MKRGEAKRIDQDEVYRLHISGMNNHEIASLVGCTSINVSWILRTKFSVSPKIIFHPKCQWTNKNFDSILGVYAIISKLGMLYIGSSNNIYKRILHHYRTLRVGKGITKLMQQHFDSYGQDAFNSVIFEKCNSIELALEREQFYINQYKDSSRLYNKTIIKNFESIDKSTIDKILNNINKRENDECWEFNGTINKHGYGEFRKVLAHRVSYEVHVGHVGSAIVGHRCNNKKCCNPKHLYLTNYSENVKYGYESRSVSAKQDY